MSMSNMAVLCGKIGKSGCGVNPLRGQNNVQGACDMGAQPTDYPGYQKVDNPEVQKKFEEGGAVLSGLAESGKHLEVMELPNHPWFVAVAYHPEFKSQPTKPHPLFADFVAAAVEHRG